jgi:glycerol-3-phosphate dehydrogenase (NAD(P)+)
MTVGMALGGGQSLEQALAGKLSVAEGVASAPAVRQLAAKHGVDMPICQAVAAILAGEAGVDAAIGDLLSRPLRDER